MTYTNNFRILSIEAVKLLETEATKFVQNLLQKLSHEAHKDKSHGE